MTMKLTPTQKRILQRLHQGPATTVTLSDFVNVSVAATRKAATKLQQMGLVTTDGFHNGDGRGRPGVIWRIV